MSRVRADCPAKVNLALHVAGRRPDGYHEIVTLFQAIDEWDTLEGRPAPDLRLDVSDPELAGEGNLVIKAARLLYDAVPAAAGRGAHLSLQKSIPVRAGLGGGSSDAAGALVLLNALWQLGLRASELATLAAQLGSDVPFFLTGGTALGEGRGEKITPLPSIRERKLILGTPAFGLSTAEVYAALRAPLTVERPDVTVPRLFVKLAEGNDFALARNDLESAVFAECSKLVTFRDALCEAGAECTLVSGSGSTVFGIFREGDDVGSIAKALGSRFAGYAVRATRTVASGVRVTAATA
jgi:4-diphosphocytidyl-2-C-methyl-D-erythritol kinase